MNKNEQIPHDFDKAKNESNPEIKREDVFDEIKNKENEYLENIPWDRLVKSIEYSADRYDKKEESINGTRFAHQATDSIGFYYGTSLRPEKFLSLISKIENVKNAFQEMMIKLLKISKEEKEQRRELAVAIPYHLLQLKALYFNNPQDFESDVMTDENKGSFLSYMNDLIERYYKKIEKAKSFQYDAEYFVVTDIIPNLQMYRILLKEKDQNIEMFINKEIGNMKDIILEFLKYIENSEKSEDEKSTIIQRIHQMLFELKFLSHDILDFGKEFINKIKSFIEENIGLNKTLQTKTTPDAHRALFFIGTMNDIIEQEKVSK